MVHEQKSQLLVSDIAQAPLEPNVSTSTDYETTSEGSDKKSPGGDRVMCGMIEIFLSEEQDSVWKPPPVTQELTYPSDDEIVPNPKACFVPRPVSQRKEVTIVPCFLVSGRSRSLKEKATPYDRPEFYRSILSPHGCLLVRISSTPLPHALAQILV